MKLTTRTPNVYLALFLTSILTACGDFEHTSKFDPQSELDKQARATLTGRFTLEGETDHAGVEIRLKGPSLKDISTQADGSFAVNELIPGSYTLTIGERGWQEISREVTLDIGAKKTLGPEELKLRTSSVTGSLFSSDSAGHDFSGFTITMQRTGSPRNGAAKSPLGTLAETSDSFGPPRTILTTGENILIENLSAGTYTFTIASPSDVSKQQALFANRNGVTTYSLAPIALAASTELDIEITGDQETVVMDPIEVKWLSGDFSIRGTLADGLTVSSLYTATRTVKLLTTAVNASKMILGEEDDQGTCTLGNTVTFVVAPTFTVSAGDGVKTLCLILANEDFSQTTYLRGSIILDQTAPQLSSVRVNGGEAFSTVNTILLELAASDNLSGLEKISRTRNLTDIGTIDYVPAFSDTITADGNYAYTLRVSDHAGNASTPATASVVIDRIAPTSPSITINGGAAWTTSNQVSLLLSATGATEMLLGNDGSFAGSFWEPYRTQVAWFLASTNGSRSVSVQFRDAAGNINAGPTSDSIDLDTVAPTSPSLMINAGSAATNGTSVQLALSAVNATKMQISNDGQFDSEPWSAYATSVNGWAIGAGDGLKTIYARYADDASNVSAVAVASILRDTAAPINTSLLIDGGAVYSTQPAGSANLTLTALDLAASVSKMKVANLPSGTCATALAAASEENFITTRSWVFTSPGAGVEGVRRVCAAFRDSTGNWSAPVSDSIQYDTLAPQISTGDVVINNGEPQTSDRLIHVDLTTGGADEIQLNLDASFGSVFWQPATTSAEMYVSRADGTITVFMRGRDAAGNISEIASAGIILDTTPPDAVAIALADIDGDGFPLTHTQAELSWSATVDPNATGYELQRFVIGSSTSFDPVTDTVVGTESFADDITATAGRVHQYRVRVIDSLGQASQWSNVLAVSSMADDGQLCWVVNQNDASDIAYTLVPPTGAISSQMSSSFLDFSAADAPVQQAFSGNVLTATQTRRPFDAGNAEFTVVSTNQDSVYRQQGKADAPMGWHFDVVDSSTVIFTQATVFKAPNDDIHLVYRDAGAGTIKHVVRSAGVWQTPEVVLSDVYPAIGEMDAAGKLHIVFRDNASSELRYITNQTGAWSSPVVIDTGAIGYNLQLRIDSQNVLHLVYAKTDDNSLRYSSAANGLWDAPVAIATAGTVRDRPMGLDVDGLDAVHISYQGFTNRDFRYVNNVGGSWNASEQLDWQNYGAEISDLRIDGNGRIHIINYNPFGSGLAHTYYSFGSWSTVIIASTWDQTGNVNPLSIDNLDGLHLLYRDNNNKLVYRAGTAFGGWSSAYTINPSLDAGQFFGISADGHRDAHIVYSTNKELRYATTAGGAFNWRETILTNNPVYASLGIDNENVGHVVYSMFQKLWYTNHKSGVWSPKWEMEPATEFPSTPGIAANSAGDFSIVYSSLSQQALRYVYWTGVTWSTPSSLDGAIGSYPFERPAIAFDTTDKLHIAYYRYDDANSRGDLRYVAGTPGNFSAPITLDATADTGYSPAIGLAPDGTVHIAYFDKTNSTVKYVRRSGGVWGTPVTVVGGTFYDAHNPVSLGIDSQGVAHISYYGLLDTGLKYVNNRGGTWSSPVVLDAIRSNLGGSSMDIDSQDRIHISYYGDGVAKYVWHTGRKWMAPVIIDGSATMGRFPSLQVDHEDRVHMIYADDTFFRSYYKYLGNEASCSPLSNLAPVSPF